MKILKHFTAIAVAALTAATPAAAQAPEDDTSAGVSAKPGATAPASSDEEQEPRAAGRPRLRLASVRPRVVRFAGRRPARIRFQLAGQRARDVQAQIVRRQDDGRRTVVRRWNLEGVPGGETQELRWAGRKGNGNPVAPGRYALRVRVKGEGLADASRADGKRSFRVYPHIFPVRGPHGYGDGVGAGRGHRGQDVFARCGTKLVAARAGRVRYRAFQGSAAGHYVVISGAKTGMEYVYMHLRGRAKVKPGQRVRTGQVIGRVGQSGNARGCHLHFELWSAPGWYRGGSHMRSVSKKLRRWDRWG